MTAGGVRLAAEVCPPARVDKRDLTPFSPNIRGFGNIARHDYGAVNLEMVWDIVQQGLPSLEASC